MAPAPTLAPAGSSSYASNTLHVGDGTWDSGRDTFLLPNLVGLNFDTMRYNGMGNRFAGLAGYHSLIKGHAIVAGITFLVIVPTAVLIVKFMMGSRPVWAVRTHIWLQIMTVILTTVIIILGFMAVGPDRALSNPHHGIGLAIYVLVLAQAFGGWFVHSRQKGKIRTTLTLKVMLHRWSGRTIALLGIVQVPLGLTLYGSPKWLFVVYTLFMFVLFVLFFVLSYKYADRLDYDDHSSYDSRSEVVLDRVDNRHSRLGSLAATGAAGAALAGLLGHRNRSRSGSHPDVVGSQRPSQSYISQEKTDYEDSRRGGGWRKRLLEIAAIGGGVALAKKFWDRRRGRDDMSYDYSTTEDSLSRVEDGRRPVTPNPRPPPRRSGSISPRSSRISVTRPGRGHAIRDGVVTLGAFGLLREAFKGRKEKQEQKRLEDIRRRELEEERIARQNSSRRRFTGDGTPTRAGRRDSYSETDSTVTGADGRSRHHHGTRPPTSSGLAPAVAAGAVTGATLGSGPNMSHNVSGPLNVPHPYADRGEDSGSEVYISDGGRNRRRHHGARDAAAVAAVAGTAAALAGNSSGRHPLRSGESVNSPPVSIKMNMHKDGRKVTLRRLTPEEAAAEREARRRDGNGKHRRHRHGDSVSSLSGNEAGGSGGNDHWRRTEDRERRQAEELRRDNEIAAQRRAQAGSATLPPPPPIGGGYGGRPPPSIGSPGTVTGTYDGTNTEASVDPASNRQRRRAERAARGSGRGSGTVDFD